MGEYVVNMIKHFVVLVIGCFAISPVIASDFDGSNPLICATVEARDCVLSLGCYAGEAKEIGAPAFMRIDFAKKTITGTERTTPIVTMEKNESQLLMQGMEMGYGWAFAINQTDGSFSASLTDINGSFLLFGSCTLD
jgi:hypothetical protein